MMNRILPEPDRQSALGQKAARTSSIENALTTLVPRSVRACLVGLGLAAIVSAAGPSSPNPVIETAAYGLTMSDLMTAVIQPRHIKLWLAAQNGDWSYAQYETGNLAGAFGRIAKAVPTYRGVATDAMLSAFMGPPLSAIESAIKARDERAFISAYEGLTAGCNQCHQAVGRSMVVIETPNSSSISDQSFGQPSHPAEH